MDLSQYAQFFEIIAGIAVIVKMVYDVKIEVLKIKTTVDQYTKLTEYKFEKLSQKVDKLEEQIS